MVSAERSLAFERWANRRMLTHLQALQDPPQRAMQLFAHVLAGMQVWLVRLANADSSGVEIWPAWSLQDCATKVAQLDESVTRILQSRKLEQLSHEISYTNQHGLSYTTAISDILFHLASHGAYHRGQICLVLRESGLEPINTDYITFVREMAGQPWKP